MNYFIKNGLLLVLIGCCISPVWSQTFIDYGKIEYEVRTNLQKSLPQGFWSELIQDKLPEFQVSYWTLTFKNDKSIYRFEKWGEPSLPEYMRRGVDEKQYYYDFAKGSYFIRKQNFSTEFNIAGDTIPKLNWKLVNENRDIAGFNCRKAYAVLFDSVYVFAFYTEEIVLPGGPQSFTGLPGTILGITIPRLYTSLIATKVEVNEADTKSINPPKAKKTLTLEEMDAVLKQRLMKDWATDNPEDKSWAERTYWDAML